ncbi:hypothetical protein EI171_00850 (plasmid) [Bradyrhizobium sp. LCT2]|uniref:hypothetical protein n=1 Tax=Bradyrhizobium sp. LCT2 TaxID=2493093 RepID=UPI001373A14F|nr:hypothetical protein [Bradyrhizobium sp. LCT2]QHP66111.1 hypothetical protein EI171_00850 [Bradyrhizobium sp. LCT2]
MLVVETIAKIRRAYFVDGRPIKAICRKLGVSRKVVRKVRRCRAADGYGHRWRAAVPEGPKQALNDRMLLVAKRLLQLAVD